MSKWNHKKFAKNSSDSRAMKSPKISKFLVDFGCQLKQDLREILILWKLLLNLVSNHNLVRMENWKIMSSH